MWKKISAVGLVLVMCAVAFSATVTNVLADEDDGEEKTFVSLNPCVATDENVHVVWQENLTGNMEIYFVNDMGIGNYEAVLREVIEELSNSPDKESQKALKNLNDALDEYSKGDYKHSIDRVHNAVKSLEKAGNTELITILVDAVRDFAKTNILYTEYDLTFNNSYIQEAYEKYLKADEKYEEENYDAAIKMFKNSYLKIVEGWEEKYGKTYFGVDFGKIVRISYTEYDSTMPQINLNHSIHVGWVEILPSGESVYYARSIDNGIRWWYFDSIKYAEPYLTWAGLPKPPININLDFLKRIIEILEGIGTAKGCHYLYGRIAPLIYAPINDPRLSLYSSYTDVHVGGAIFKCPGPRPDPEPPKAPDIVAKDITFSPTTAGRILAGPTTVSVTVKNIGNVDASGSFDVDFYDNDVKIATETISSLLVGVSKIVSKTWDLTIGAHTIRVEAARCWCSDGDTTNNIVTIDIDVLPQKKYAIVVGISDYKSVTPDLSYCDEDANDWYYYLTGSKKSSDSGESDYTCTIDVTFDEVWVFGDKTSSYAKYDGVATEYNVKQAIKDLVAKVGPTNLIAFISSGHGGGSSTTECYLHMWDSGAGESGEDGNLYDSELKTLFAPATAGRIFISLDHCHSGGMNGVMGNANKKYVYLTTTCNADGFGWDSGSVKNGLYTNWFLNKGLRNGESSHNDMEGNFDWTDANYPKTGNDNPCEFDGDTTNLFYL